MTDNNVIQFSRARGELRSVPPLLSEPGIVTVVLWDESTYEYREATTFAQDGVLMVIRRGRILADFPLTEIFSASISTRLKVPARV